MAYTKATKIQCELCDMFIGSNGWAQYHHWKKHAREGLVDKYGRLTEEGKKIKEQRKKELLKSIK